MKALIACSLILALLSCTKSETNFTEPEYTDWYTVQAPIDDVIQGLWGDYNGNLLIATTYSLFRSTDQGKSWVQVGHQQTSISGLVEHRDTLFTTTGIINRDAIQLMANVSQYSIDKGKNWSTYQKYNTFFDITSSRPVDQKLYINLKTASNGIVYKINQVYLDSTITIRRYETPGLVTSNGRKIDLPQRHQIRSLYIDDKNRIYIIATDRICDQSSSGFLFCNSKNGRGLVYISKQPLP